MASWMVHFRIADIIMDYIPNVDMEQFIVGNIAPDCGEPNEDWSDFTPSPKITHWNDTGKKQDIDYEKFFDTYIRDNEEKGKLSFYIGYYIHLITDVLWMKMILSSTKEKFKEAFLNDKNFIWTVKEDWYNLDHLFLRNNPDFRTFRIFDKIKAFPNVYLDYYSDTAIEKQIKYISDFYNNFTGNLDGEYRYLNESQMNDYVKEGSEYILEHLKEKRIIE
ncbi:MAG: hypothetical protein E7205_06965 [Tissierellaceae bacterium]|jgi:hypothetical protein|nr:hypothetical protein [Tissierellaceae bacterium]